MPLTALFVFTVHDPIGENETAGRHVRTQPSGKATDQQTAWSRCLFLEDKICLLSGVADSGAGEEDYQGRPGWLGPQDTLITGPLCCAQ